MPRTDLIPTGVALASVLVAVAQSLTLLALSNDSLDSLSDDADGAVHLLLGNNERWDESDSVKARGGEE